MGKRDVRGRDLIEPAVWWVVLLATYLAIVSTISVTEILVGVPAAAAGAAVAVVTRRALLAADNPERYLPRPAWLRWLLPLPVQILTDSLRLLRPHGEFDELRLPDDDRRAALRGFAALTVSASPGAYVAEVLPDRGDLVLHRISRRRSAVEREISR